MLLAPRGFAVLWSSFSLRPTRIIPRLHFQNVSQIAGAPEPNSRSTNHRRRLDPSLGYPGLQRLAGDSGPLCHLARCVEPRCHNKIIAQFDRAVKIEVH